MRINRNLIKSGILLLIIFLLLPGRGQGQYTELKFKRLSLQDGLSQSSVNCIIQDHKGFMWFGTQDGLNKFDGYEITVFDHDLFDSTSISNGFIHDIYEDEDRKLWVGTERGLNYFDRSKQQFQRIYFQEPDLTHALNNVWAIEKTGENLYLGTERGLISFNKKTQKHLRIPLHIDDSENLKIRDLEFDDKGILWIATEGNGLIQYHPETQRSFQHLYHKKNNSISSNMVWSLFFDDEQNELLIGTQNGLNVFSLEEKHIYHYKGLSNSESVTRDVIKKVFKDRSGVIWLGSEGGGLIKFKKGPGEVKTYLNRTNVSYTLSSDIVLSIYEDKNENVWIGTEVGVNRFDRNKQFFKHYQHQPNQDNSLMSNTIWSVLAEKKNSIWVGTNIGLDKFDREEETFEHFIPFIEGKKEQKNSSIYSIYNDHKDVLWVGTDGGVYTLDKKTGAFRHFQGGTDPNISRVYCIFEDSRKRFWLGTRDGLLCVNASRTKTYRYNHDNLKSNEIASNIIRVITEDNNGKIWIGTEGGLSRVHADSLHDLKFHNYQTDYEDFGTLSNNTVLSLHCDTGNIIWVGTFGGGLNKFNSKEETFQHFTEKDGLPNNVIYAILDDKKGHLWMSTNKGISKFNKKNGTFKNFKEHDGLQSNEFNVGAHDMSSWGEMFFGGINGLNSFYPSNVRKNPHPPEVVITDFLLFNKHVYIDSNAILDHHISTLKEVKLSYHQNVISFEYAALHYTYPKENVYSYMLEGFDEDWIYAGHSRKANYTNLDPGEYTFKVKAANSDGVWSEEHTEIKLIIEPPFWMTWWFRIIVIIAILGSIFLYYKARINSIKAKKRLLEVQVRERTAEINTQKEKIEKQNLLLEEEKDKVEKLLLNILPQNTVEELKIKGKARARSYRMVTVMFADFKNFTQIAETLKPKELVSELDSYFIKFDEIIHKYDVEKIKTIGDSYMCAGGVPIRNKSNPIDVVLAGLEIQHFVMEFNKQKIESGKKPWDLRVGIHTGDLIAGVIGIKRFAYDIWGDTVNIASRMESSSAVNNVNISGKTYELVKEFFTCKYRGKVAAKNKGQIDMYYVNGIRPELSEKEEGKKPNEKFWKYVNLHLYSKINYRKAEKYIVKRLEKELPDNLYYHSIAHTKDVCNSIERIALMEGIEGEDLFLLKTAALYHDAGFVSQYEDNEPIGAALAEEVLPRFGYTEKEISVVKELILSTKVPQKPKNHLQQIICDADLDYLGRDDFHKIADKLKQELLDRGKVKDDKQWDEIQVKFLTAHTYFTDSAKKMRMEGKLKHLQEIKDRLEEYE